MVGLVLEGGGVKGSYQIGSYLAFKKCGIKIDGIVGTSIGSFNGAMIASGKDKELYEFWKNIDIGYILGLNENYVKSVNDKKLFKEFIYGLVQTKEIIENKGISPDKMKKTLDIILDEKKLRKSNMDYGLVTVKLKSVKNIKPLYLFKEDMEEGKVSEYILASCNLPVFKKTKLIDGEYYVDGGFYDNSPIKMLIDKGYNKIYVVNIQGIGIYKKKKKDINTEIINIVPSRYLGGTLNVDKEKINDNIKLGYYDTLKLLKNYDGFNFIFKKRLNMLYNMNAKRVNDDLLKRVKKFFGVESNKEAIIKSLEYVMVKEGITYYDIYSIRFVIKWIKNNTNKKHFVYQFIKSL